VVHKYGDEFSGRSEYRSPSFDALRLRTELVEVTGPSSRLRTGPAGLLRANGRKDGTPVPQDERPTTLAGHPEEARFFRAVSKDQGERIRKRIYEMLHQG
jgi:hypothetical protein